MNQLNLGKDEAIKAAEEAALEHEIPLSMRVIKFSSTWEWTCGDAEHGMEHIDWKPLTASGGTAAAIDLARSVMDRRIPPIVCFDFPAFVKRYRTRRGPRALLRALKG